MSRAPLRFLFGWVVYVALWCAVMPVVRAAFAFAAMFPAVGMVSALVAGVLLIALVHFGFRSFWRWNDRAVHKQSFKRATGL